MSGDVGSRSDSGGREASATVDLRHRVPGEWRVAYIVEEAVIFYESNDHNVIWFNLEEGEVLSIKAGETTVQIRAARRGRVLPEETVVRQEYFQEPDESQRQDNQLRHQTSRGCADESESVERTESRGRGEGGRGDGDGSGADDGEEGGEVGETAAIQRAAETGGQERSSGKSPHRSSSGGRYGGLEAAEVEGLKAGEEDVGRHHQTHTSGPA